MKTVFSIVLLAAIAHAAPRQVKPANAAPREAEPAHDCFTYYYLCNQLSDGDTQDANCRKPFEDCQNACKATYDDCNKGDIGDGHTQCVINYEGCLGFQAITGSPPCST